MIFDIHSPTECAFYDFRYLLSYGVQYFMIYDITLSCGEPITLHKSHSQFADYVHCYHFVFSYVFKLNTIAIFIELMFVEDCYINYYKNPM